MLPLAIFKAFFGTLVFSALLTFIIYDLADVIKYRRPGRSEWMAEPFTLRCWRRLWEKPLRCRFGRHHWIHMLPAKWQTYTYHYCCKYCPDILTSFERLPDVKHFPDNMHRCER